MSFKISLSLPKITAKVIKAKKSYGQHFLNNEVLAAKIVDSLDHLSPNYNVLEIGPGKGVLTKYLLKKNINLKAVDADADMINFLTTNYPQVEGRLILLDFLKLNLTKLFDGNEMAIIGNFPYNISSQIVIKMINSKHLVTEMVGMFQKEVAERIIAPHGGKDYGSISVLTQAYYEGKIIYRLPPGAFSPPPKVDSAVLHLKRKSDLELGCNEKYFRTVVKVSFNQRRKMLRNTLKPLVNDVVVLQDDFFNNRPEQLSVKDFVFLTNKLQPFIKDEFRTEN